MDASYRVDANKRKARWFPSLQQTFGALEGGKSKLTKIGGLDDAEGTAVCIPQAA